MRVEVLQVEAGHAATLRIINDDGDKIVIDFTSQLSEPNELRIDAPSTTDVVINGNPAVRAG